MHSCFAFNIYTKICQRLWLAREFGVMLVWKNISQIKENNLKFTIYFSLM